MLPKHNKYRCDCQATKEGGAGGLYEVFFPRKDMNIDQELRQKQQTFPILTYIIIWFLIQVSGLGKGRAGLGDVGSSSESCWCLAETAGEELREVTPRGRRLIFKAHPFRGLLAKGRADLTGDVLREKREKRCSVPPMGRWDLERGGDDPGRQIAHFRSSNPQERIRDIPKDGMSLERPRMGGPEFLGKRT